MPIINTNQNTPPQVHAFKPKVLSVAVHSEIVDTRFTPMASLLTHIEGSAWLCHYYRQLVARDTELTAQQLNKEGVYQQYVLIKSFELKVTSDLSRSQDTNSTEQSLTGTSLLYPGTVKPSKGDMFVADVGDGREAVFAVTEVEQMAIYKDACYQISYQLQDYNVGVRRADLNKKVVQTLMFVKDFITYGQNPLLAEEDYISLQELSRLYGELLGHYFADFFSTEYQSILMPDQNYPTYDPFLVKALLSCLDSNEHRLVQKVRAFNTDDDLGTKASSVWDALLQLSEHELPMVFHEVGLIESSYFDLRAEFESIYYSGVRHVVYPKEPRTDIDAQYDRCRPNLTGTLQVSKPRRPDLKRMLSEDLNGFFTETAPVEGIMGLPDIKLVTVDQYYVLSEQFYYDRAGEQSKLERLTWQALKHEPLHLDALKRVCMTARSWGNLERFYYIPLLLILLKTALRGL